MSNYAAAAKLNDDVRPGRRALLEARGRVHDNHLRGLVAAILVPVRLLRSVTNRITSIQQIFGIADDEFNLPLHDIGNFLAFMSNQTATAPAWRDVVNTALKQPGFIVGNEALECQPRPVAQRIDLDDRPLAGARQQAARFG